MSNHLNINETLSKVIAFSLCISKILFNRLVFTCLNKRETLQSQSDSQEFSNQAKNKISGICVPLLI